MSSDETSHAGLDGLMHHTVVRGFIDNGFGPSTAELAGELGISEDSASESLRRLESIHGVVLDPKSGQVWIAHPFSSTPTLFCVVGLAHRWWAPCIWCALGVAALVDEAEVRILTRLGGDGACCEFSTSAQSLASSGLLAHFPIPPARAWDNVHRHCACTLVFDSEKSITEWCARHRISRGEVLPLAHAAAFARIWYGDHLSREWRKPSLSDAQALFERAGLTSRHWRLEGGVDHF
ncbi:MAG: hypothetical protein KDA32_02745 [Phycisphaerales bacterium]|nr:hypothetical protein [Phycisphaerales bacterium]